MRLTVAWVRSVLVRDPDIYPDDPMRFYLERFLTEDVAKPLAGHWAFGAGRRGLVTPQPQTIHYFTFLLLHHLFRSVAVILPPALWDTFFSMMQGLGQEF